jgi:hypothetical protein
VAAGFRASIHLDVGHLDHRFPARDVSDASEQSFRRGTMSHAPAVFGDR